MKHMEIEKMDSCVPLLNKKGKELSHWTILKELEPAISYFLMLKKITLGNIQEI